MAAMPAFMANMTTVGKDEIGFTFFVAGYSLSAVSLKLVILVHLISLKTLGKMNKKVSPLMIARGYIILQCSFFLLINVITEMIVVIFSIQNYLYYLQLLSILCTLLFYMWCFALYLLSFYISEDVKIASYMVISKYLYVIAYVVPVLVTSVIAALSSYQDKGKDKKQVPFHKRTDWKCLLLTIRLLVIYVMTASNTYSFGRETGSFRKKGHSALTKIALLCNMPELRNGIMLELNLLALWILNAVLVLHLYFGLETSRAILYVTIVSQSLLGPHFLLFEVLGNRQDIFGPFGKDKHQFEQQCTINSVRNGSVKSSSIKRLNSRNEEQGKILKLLEINPSIPETYL